MPRVIVKCNTGRVAMCGVRRTVVMRDNWKTSGHLTAVDECAASRARGQVPVTHTQAVPEWFSLCPVAIRRKQNLLQRRCGVKKNNLGQWLGYW